MSPLEGFKQEREDWVRSIPDNAVVFAKLGDLTANVRVLILRVVPPTGKQRSDQVVFRFPATDPEEHTMPIRTFTHWVHARDGDVGVWR